MIKKIIIIIIIVFVIVFLLYDFWQNWQKDAWKIALIKDARQEMDVVQYGNTKLEESKRNLINKIIEVEAQSEGWIFKSQEGFELLKTNNSEIPFMTTVKYLFQDIQNNNVYHLLTKSYIYDDYYRGWAPLISDLDEFNEIGSIRYKNLGRWRLWQGDWEVPIFENSTSSNKTPIIPWNE